MTKVRRRARTSAAAVRVYYDLLVSKTLRRRRRCCALRRTIRSGDDGSRGMHSAVIVLKATEPISDSVLRLLWQAAGKFRSLEIIKHLETNVS